MPAFSQGCALLPALGIQPFQIRAALRRVAEFCSKNFANRRNERVPRARAWICSAKVERSMCRTTLNACILGADVGSLERSFDHGSCVCGCWKRLAGRDSGAVRRSSGSHSNSRRPGVADFCIASGIREAGDASSRRVRNQDG